MTAHCARLSLAFQVEFPKEKERRRTLVPYEKGNGKTAVIALGGNALGNIGVRLNQPHPSRR